MFLVERWFLLKVIEHAVELGRRLLVDRQQVVRAEKHAKACCFQFLCRGVVAQEVPDNEEVVLEFLDLGKRIRLLALGKRHGMYVEEMADELELFPGRLLKVDPEKFALGNFDLLEGGGLSDLSGFVLKVNPHVGSFGIRCDHYKSVSYTHLRAHETRHDLVC